MNKIFCMALSMALISSSAIANEQILPAPLVTSINKAHGTQDSFIIDSVIAAATANYPELEEDIKGYVYSLNEVEAEKAAIIEKEETKEFAIISPASGEKEEKSWKGNVELGATYETGNSKKENLNGSAKITNSFGEWDNILKLKVATNKENDIRNSEEYRVNNQLRNNISENGYVFGELEYVKDRFSGYEYRTSELLGYGHHLIKEDHIKLSAEASLGARQSKVEGIDSENSFLGKVGGDFIWDMNDNFTFTQDFDISFSSEATITESETAIKSKISDSLYLKLGFEVEHISDVPDDTKNTDTITSVKVGYDF